LKNRILKSIVILNVVAMLMLATAATTFAAPGGEKGPPAPVATGGLATALTNVQAHAADKGANDAPEIVPEGAPGFSTHTAVGRVGCLNPAVDAAALGFDISGCPE